MKRTHIIALTAFVVFLTGCKNEKCATHSYKGCEVVELTPYERNGYQIVEIQFPEELPHEYVVGYNSLTHYPNCHYCIQAEYDRNR